jgi:hypothetical protein
MRLYYKKGGRVDKGAMACNKPKRTPGHSKKSHIVKACEGGKEKNIKRGKMSAAYWADKVKWSPSKTKSKSTKWKKGS